MNIKKIALISLPIILLCACGETQAPLKNHLVKIIEKTGISKDAAKVTEYTEYTYLGNVISEESRYVYVNEDAKLKAHTIYSKNTSTEQDFLLYEYNNDGSLREIDHFIYKLDYRGRVIYELHEYKDKEGDPYLTIVEMEMIVTYNSKGLEETIIKHEMSGKQYWYKQVNTFDSLGRIIESNHSQGETANPDYVPKYKYTYTYVGNTNDIDLETYYLYNTTDFAKESSTKHTYNSSMLLTKLELFDSQDVLTDEYTTTYEGKIVTTINKQFNISSQTLETDNEVIEEYASTFVKGMDNPISVTEYKYNHGHRDSKTVNKYTYISSGEIVLKEYESYDIDNNEWVLSLYNSTEYLYEKF